MTRLVPLALLFVAAGCGVDVVTPPTAEAERSVATAPELAEEAPRDHVAVDRTDLQEVVQTLDAVAAAFRDGDRDALARHLHDPESDFGQRWLERLENLAEVPLETYRLVVEPTTADLATRAVRARFDEPVRVLHVREHHAIAGYDLDGPAIENLFLTVVETDDGWRVASDRDGEPLGLNSVTHLWDLGPVVMATDGTFAAVHHPGVAGRIPDLLAESHAALDDMDPRWALGWSERVPIIVPRDQEELGRLLNVTFDLTNFIAFATATVDGQLGEYRLTGSRVVVNPDSFFARPSATRQRVLAHELLHVATRPHGGPMTPSWVEEGVAQRLGEDGSATGTALLMEQVRRGDDGRLPLDAEFTTGDRDRIWLSYQTSYSFAAHLADTYGEEALARFYAELGRGSVGEPGRRAHHLERAAQEVFGSSLADLRDEWLRQLRAG